MDDFPIEIHVSKLPEWIEDRSVKLKKDNSALYDVLRTAASTLNRNWIFEIPPLRLEIQKARNTIRKHETEIEQLRKKILSSSNELEKNTETLGISSDETEDRIFDTIQTSVTEWLRNTEQHLRILKDAFELYVNFVDWNVMQAPTDDPKNPNTGGLLSEESNGKPHIGRVLKRFLDVGNAPSSEYLQFVPFLDEWDLATPVLLCDKTRCALSSDIHEVLSFFEIRMWEAQEKFILANPVMHNFMMASISFSSGDHTDLCQGYRNQLHQALELLEGKQTTHILLLRSSPHYRSRMTSTLKLLKEQISRCESSIFKLEHGIVEMRSSLSSNERRLQDLIKISKNLQKQCEQNLRTFYAPREVQILGT